MSRWRGQEEEEQKMEEEEEEGRGEGGTGGGGCGGGGRGGRGGGEGGGGGDIEKVSIYVKPSSVLPSVRPQFFSTLEANLYIWDAYDL